MNLSLTGCWAAPRPAQAPGLVENPQDPVADAPGSPCRLDWHSTTESANADVYKRQDRVCCLVRGEVLVEGTGTVVQNDPRVIEAYIGTPPADDEPASDAGTGQQPGLAAGEEVNDA